MSDGTADDVRARLRQASDRLGDALEPVVDALERAFAYDALKVAVLFAGIWALFYAFGSHLGYPTDGIVSTIRRVTFLSAVYAIVVLALNLQWGYAGLFNIGVAGFMAVGAYTFAMLSSPTTAAPSGLGLPVPIGIAGALVASTAVGLVASLPALRLKADYLAIVTVAISEIIRITYNSPAFADITGGASGFDALPTNPVRMLLLQNPRNPFSEPTGLGQFLFTAMEGFGVTRLTAVNIVYTVAVLVVLLLVYLLLERTGKSPFGRVLKAIREDEVATRSLGKDTQNFKIRAFALGCALMGLGGILWYAMGPRASLRPMNFRPELTFYIFIALIIGGSGSNTGSILGGAVFASLLFEAPPLLRQIVGEWIQVETEPGNLVEALVPISNGQFDPLIGFLMANIDTLRFVFMGVLLVVLVQRKPEGLLGARKETAATVDLRDRGTPRQSALGVSDGGTPGSPGTSDSAGTDASSDSGGASDE